MKCLYCDEEIKGRSDKKFCDNNCKSAWHKAQANPKEAEIKRINKILRRNRSVLKFYSPQGKTTVRKKFLVDQGYNFKYFTQVYKTKNDNVYYLCYDYGFMLLEDEKVLIIQKQDYM